MLLCGRESLFFWIGRTFAAWLWESGRILKIFSCLLPMPRAIELTLPWERDLRKGWGRSNRFWPEGLVHNFSGSKKEQWGSLVYWLKSRLPERIFTIAVSF